MKLTFTAGVSGGECYVPLRWDQERYADNCDSVSGGCGCDGVLVEV